jgi:hypothetical protein
VGAAVEETQESRPTERRRPTDRYALSFLLACCWFSLLLALALFDFAFPLSLYSPTLLLEKNWSETSRDHFSQIIKTPILQWFLASFAGKKIKSRRRERVTTTPSSQPPLSPFSFF